MPPAKPLAKSIELGDMDEQTAFTFFDPSPEAEQQFIESYLTVPNEHMKIVDFKLYPQQKRMLFDATGRDITVKGRQTRASSLILARNLRPMVTQWGVKQLVMTQDDQTTTQFRQRIRHHIADLQRNGWGVEVHLDNENEMVIEGLENHYIFASGQQKVAGRAYTAGIVHLSEICHWPDQERARALLGAITPAVPGPPHGRFDIESTPNGAEDVFFDYVMSARPQDVTARWLSHFYPWWTEPRYRGGIGIDCDLVLSEQEYLETVSSFIPNKWEETLIGQFNVTIDQILWRRYMVKEMAKTGVPFEQEYVETLETCFVSVGDSFFSSSEGTDHLGWYRNELTDPLLIKTSIAYKGGDVSFYGANLRVWEPPQAGEPYVGWVDCAGGGLDERADFSVLIVINALSNRHVATLRLKTAPTEFAAMVAAVMTWYNTGLLGGERDAFGLTCVQALQKLRYSNLWFYVNPVERRDPTKLMRVAEPWMHPTQGRDRILQQFRASIFMHSFLTRDRQLLLEMGAFTWQKTRGREGLKAAGKGQKDDEVIAAAGANSLCERARESYTNRQTHQDTILVAPNGVILNRKADTRRPWLR